MLTSEQLKEIREGVGALIYFDIFPNDESGDVVTCGRMSCPIRKDVNALLTHIKELEAKHADKKAD